MTAQDPAELYFTAGQPSMRGYQQMPPAQYMPPVQYISPALYMNHPYSVYPGGAFPPSQQYQQSPVPSGYGRAQTAPVIREMQPPQLPPASHSSPIVTRPLMRQPIAAELASRKESGVARQANRPSPEQNNAMGIPLMEGPQHLLPPDFDFNNVNTWPDLFPDVDVAQQSHPNFDMDKIDPLANLFFEQAGIEVGVLARPEQQDVPVRKSELDFGHFQRTNASDLPPRPAREPTPGPVRPAGRVSPAPKARGPDGKLLDHPKDWLFIPDEIEELYAGQRWPNLYGCLLLTKVCDAKEVLPAFEKQIIQHFPVLRMPYKPDEANSLERFLRFILNQLPNDEHEEYKIPYLSFGSILREYRREWEDWTKRPKSRTGPKKMFEEIFLAFIILNNPHYREQYDNDRDTKDPFGSNNQFFSSLSREPNYTVQRAVEGRGITCEQRIPKVGVWVSTETQGRMNWGRGKIFREIAEEWQIRTATEELEWVYDRGGGSRLVQRQQRSCRTGWWAEIEKIANLALSVARCPLFDVAGSGDGRGEGGSGGRRDR